MTIDPIWEEVHKGRQWGTCPEPAMARFAMRHFGATERERVRFLDLGCGAGAQSIWLAQQGFYVLSVDGSTSAIETATSRAEKLLAQGLVGMDLFVGDVCNLGFAPDFHVDAVVDVCCLQHVRDVETAIAEVRRVLKPGGWFFSMAAADHHSEEALEMFWTRRLSPSDVSTVYGVDWSETKIGKHAWSYGNGITIAHWLIEVQKP